MTRLRRVSGDERGITLIELLVSAAMGVVVMAATASLVITAVKDQPKISKEAQNVSTARWVLGRMTHELRNGMAVKEAGPSRVSFETYVRKATCGGTAQLPSTSPAIRCRVTYECTISSCSRVESPPGSSSGTAIRIFSGIDSNQVFSYSPPKVSESAPYEPTYVKATLHLPNPSGTGSLTVSDGASLRNATLGY